MFINRLFKDDSMLELEKALKITTTEPKKDIIDHLTETIDSNLLDGPDTYIPSDSTIFDPLLKKIGENQKNEISVHVKPIYKDKKIDGLFISFKMRF